LTLIAEDGKVNCILNNKHFWSEDKAIILTDVSDIRSVSSHVMYYYRGEDNEPKIRTGESDAFDRFEILYRNSEDDLMIYSTKTLKRFYNQQRFYRTNRNSYTPFISAATAFLNTHSTTNPRESLDNFRERLRTSFSDHFEDVCWVFRAPRPYNRPAENVIAIRLNRLPVIAQPMSDLYVPEAPQQSDPTVYQDVVVMGVYSPPLSDTIPVHITAFEINCNNNNQNQQQQYSDSALTTPVVGYGRVLTVEQV
jgi:hypothetical protein